jgi:hypothetical protein
MKLLGIIIVGFKVTNQLLIRFSAFVRITVKYSHRVWVASGVGPADYSVFK